MYATTPNVPAVVRTSDDAPAVRTLRGRLAAALREKRAAEADALYWNREAVSLRRAAEEAHRRRQADPVRDDSAPTPAEVLDSTRPWDDVIDPARGEFTFGVLAEADAVVLADEDLATEAEWQDRQATLERLHAGASLAYGDPEYRGVLAGHELD